MSAVGVVLTTACPRCRESFPVNAIAPAARCPKCASVVSIDGATWKKVLEAPALDGPLAEPGRDHIEPVPGNVSFVRNYVRRDAACARCSGELPLPQSLVHAARGWCICVHCGDRVSVRALPPEVAGLGGITHVVGEDFTALSNAATSAPALSASQAETVTCPACGGLLPVDGGARAVSCRHCHAQVVIPDAVWAKLHPLPVQRVFFLWHDPAKSAVASTGQMDLAWQDVRDVVVDAHGNLYFLGGRNESVFMSEQLTIWSTDASLALRWVREKIHFEMDDATQARLAIAPSGFLVLYVNAGLFNGRHSAMVLSCADGTTAATLGGVEPDDATAHHFDLKYVGSLTCDVDGTLLGLLHNRLLRWTHDGKPLETWPPKRGIFGEQHQKLRPLFYRDEKGERHALYADEKYPPGVDEIKDRPTEISSDSSTCLVGPDGALYLQNDEHLAKLDRAGTVLYRASLPEKGSNRGRPCADGYGNLYVIRSTARTKTHSIFRVSPDGRDTRVVVDGSAIGTPISDADVLAVLPDGTMVVFADEASVRIFGADGRARFLSEKARKDDADAARERAREDE